MKRVTTGAYMASANAGLLAEEVRAVRSSQRFAPDRRHPIDVGLCTRSYLEARIVGFEVHRQRRAQVAEARMHLAGDRAAAGARRSARRHQLGLGAELIEVFGDRQRIPDLDAVVGEAG